MLSRALSSFCHWGQVVAGHEEFIAWQLWSLGEDAMACLLPLLREHHDEYRHGAFPGGGVPGFREWPGARALLVSFANSEGFDEDLQGELALPLTDDELEQGHQCYASMTQGRLPLFNKWCESDTRDPPPADFTTTNDCGGGDWEDSDYF